MVRKDTIYMNGTLQDLVELYFYNVKGVTCCQVNLKGQLDPYDIVSPGDLLGDIIEISEMIKVNGILKSSYLESSGNTDYDVIQIDGRRYLSLAEVICTCFPRDDEYTWMQNPEERELGLELGWKSTDIIDDTLLFFEEICNKKGLLSRKSLDIFCHMFSRYYPLNTRLLDYREYMINSEMKADELPIVFEEESESIEEALLKDTEYTVYRYECDTLVEIIMALLHFITKDNHYIKKCEICNRYFVPLKRSDEKYCCRNVFGESCKMLGRKNKRRKRLQNNRITKKYNSLCTNLTNRIYAKKNAYDKQKQEECRKVLFSFKEEYLKRKTTMPEEELISWMNTYLARNHR